MYNAGWKTVCNFSECPSREKVSLEDLEVLEEQF